MSNSAADLQWLKALPRTKFSFYNIVHYVIHFQTLCAVFIDVEYIGN